jgi:hypothetical protein
MQAPVAVTTALMYDRCAAVAAGGCATFVRAADDHVLNVNVARLTGGIPRVNRANLFYRVHPRSTTTVSPMVVPYLTTLLALRHGRVLPSETVDSAFVNHLISHLHNTPLTALEQASLLVLSTPRGTHARRLGGLMKRRLTSSVRSVRQSAERG